MSEGRWGRSRREDRNVLLHGEELINVFQAACSCSFVCTQTGAKHKGISQLVEPLAS